MKYVTVKGEDKVIECDLDVDNGGMIVWKHEHRLLFAGATRIHRDFRISVADKKGCPSKANLFIHYQKSIQGSEASISGFMASDLGPEAVP